MGFKTILRKVGRKSFRRQSRFFRTSWVWRAHSIFQQRSNSRQYSKVVSSPGSIRCPGFKSRFNHLITFINHLKPQSPYLLKEMGELIKITISMEFPWDEIRCLSSAEQNLWHRLIAQLMPITTIYDFSVSHLGHTSIYIT